MQEEKKLLLHLQLGTDMFAIREVTGEYDYSVMGMDFQEIDGGLYDNKDVSIAEALAIVLGDILAFPGSSLLRGSISESSALEEIDYIVFAKKAGF